MKLIKQYPLVSFFVLAYAITWTLQLTAILLAPSRGMTLNNETNFLYFIDLLSMRLSPGQALVYGLFTLGAGPLFAALLVTWVVEGKTGLHDLWEQSTRWKISARWYLVALGLPLLLSAGSLGLGVLLSGSQPAYTPKLPIAYFLPFFLYMLVFTGVVEEPGWRGFALPRLQRRYSAYRASWILGIMWGLWHLPFIVYYTAALGIIPLLVSVLILTFGTAGWTIVNTWLYNSTRSVWLMILLHGWGNTVQSYLVLSSNNMVAPVLYGILPWVIALVLLWVYGKEHLARHPRPQGNRVPDRQREPEAHGGMTQEHV
jgi:hypothetical protein